MATEEKKLSGELTEHIARLAHIDITEKEKEMFTGQMNSILEHFEQLKEVDTENVEATRHPMEISNVFRKDEVKKGLSQEEATKNAPETEDGFIKAPRII